MWMDPLSDQKIIDSWKQNVAAWTHAVRTDQIESRTQVTNQAILETILQLSPKTLIDIGCGEGWLTHTLAQQNIDILGIDAVPGLIEQAKKIEGGRFEVLSYEDIAAKHLQEKFEVAVCNFSLIGHEAVEDLFQSIPTFLSAPGHFVVQTIHPVVGCGNQPYIDGWRPGSWQGFSNQFIDPAPWYFRTLESWVTLFIRNGFQLTAIREPIDPKTQQPTSLILIGRLA